VNTEVWKYSQENDKIWKKLTKVLACSLFIKQMSDLHKILQNHIRNLLNNMLTFGNQTKYDKRNFLSLKFISL